MSRLIIIFYLLMLVKYILSIIIKKRAICIVRSPPTSAVVIKFRGTQTSVCQKKAWTAHYFNSPESKWKPLLGTTQFFLDSFCFKTQNFQKQNLFSVAEVHDAQCLSHKFLVRIWGEHEYKIPSLMCSRW